MFTLCSDPAPKPRDIFPPVVTHGKENIYHTHTHTPRPCDDHVFVDVQDILNVHVLGAKFIVRTAVPTIMMHGRNISFKRQLLEIIH